MMLPKVEGKPLYVVDWDYEHKAFQDFMHSDLVKKVVTSGKFPSVFRDPDYPDLIVVWDAGESPHSPACYQRDVLENDGWLKDEHLCYPHDLWAWVETIATYHLGSAADTTYCMFWLRGMDAADREDE